MYPAQFISDFANKDFASPKLFTFQGKNELPEFPHFNARRHLQRFGNDVPAIQHYSPARGGWVNISTAFLFTIKEGKPIVLRRDGVTQMSSFDKDWEHANRPVGPVDYHLDMTNVRRTYREDKARQQKARSYSADVKPLPARLSSPAATVATPPSSSSSDLEVIGDVVLTPTKTVIPSLKRTAMGLRDGGRLHKQARHRTPPARGSYVSAPSRIPMGLPMSHHDGVHLSIARLHGSHLPVPRQFDNPHHRFPHHLHLHPASRQSFPMANPVYDHLPHHLLHNLEVPDHHPRHVHAIHHPWKYPHRTGGRASLGMMASTAWSLPMASK